MSFYRRGDGLFWPSLFSVSKEEEKDFIYQIKNILPDYTNYTSQVLAIRMLEHPEKNILNFSSADPCVQSACERVALKFMLCDSDLAKDLLDEGELEKANEVFARKQYSSKVLKKLLGYFLCLMNELTLRGHLTSDLFIIPFINEYNKVQDEEFIRSFGPLKKVIEKIASGVKSNCYYSAEGFSRTNKSLLNEELNQFAIKKVDYDFNDASKYKPWQRSTLFCNEESSVNNSILQLALLDDAEFWSKHEHFSIIGFLNNISELNDIRHAEKILSYIIENLQEMPNMKLVLKNNFPLYMSNYDELVRRLESQASRFLCKRLEGYCDLSLVDTVNLCYPMSKADPTHLEVGKSLWKRFIEKYNYPNDYTAVNHYIENEIKRYASCKMHSDDDIAVILDFAPFRYSADNEDKRLFSAYHHDCFSHESIWNRVYLKSYAISLLSNDENMQFSFMQRIFIDLVKAIEQRLNICTVHQLDTSTREKKYLQLKALLSSYGIEANDELKKNYIIALLDRDTALIEEASAFPMLEQAGDAVYGLAVAELMFFNGDDPYGDNMAEQFEKYTRAEAQVFIAKHLKIDELYLRIGLPAKYTEYDTLSFNKESYNDVNLQLLNREKYIADCLEMIIGAVFIDKGINEALRFTKRLLKEAFPDVFNGEVHIEDKGHNENIDWEYWQRILPGLYSAMCDAHCVMWRALNKALLVASLGTDDKNKRIFITNSVGNTAIYDDSASYAISLPFYFYLHNGLDFVLQKYGDIIRNNYNKK